jgi:hypothetical protein
MVKVFDAGTQTLIGTLTEAQFQQIVDALEEETVEDRDYYINRATIELLEERSADPEVVALLRRGLGDREEMDIRWEPA